MPENLSNVETVLNNKNATDRDTILANRKTHTANDSYLLDELNEFCIYEGPKDIKNYWRNFRILAEDLNQFKFYQIFKNTSREGKINNCFTCFNIDYDF